jgi:hypothetical protein
MQKGFIASILFTGLVALTVLQGCKKESALGIDNDKVIKTPYSLYAANKDGWLIHTNDGEHYTNIFPPDGYAPGQIATSGNNLLLLKKNLHLSENNGKNFNPVFYSARQFPWQNMIYDCRAHNRLYISSTTGRGVSFSSDHGLTWVDDEAWEEGLPAGFEVSSFSSLGNGVLFCYSNQNNTLFRKDNEEANWKPVTMQGLLPVTGAAYYLTSNNNMLFLTDYNGHGGVWYSDNEGMTFNRIAQGAMPRNYRLHCTAAPDGGNGVLVGTDTSGVYRAENGQFVSSTVGLERNTNVYSITVKKNIYKNDAIRTYVFIATNKGIYRSEDNGLSWDKMTFGSWDGHFKAAY